MSSFPAVVGCHRHDVDSNICVTIEKANSTRRWPEYWNSFCRHLKRKVGPTGFEIWGKQIASYFEIACPLQPFLFFVFLILLLIWMGYGRASFRSSCRRWSQLHFIFGHFGEETDLLLEGIEPTNVFPCGWASFRNNLLPRRLLDLYLSLRDDPNYSALKTITPNRKEKGKWTPVLTRLVWPVCQLASLLFSFSLFNTDVIID